MSYKKKNYFNFQEIYTFWNFLVLLHLIVYSFLKIKSFERKFNKTLISDTYMEANPRDYIM